MKVVAVDALTFDEHARPKAHFYNKQCSILPTTARIFNTEHIPTASNKLQT